MKISEISSRKQFLMENFGEEIDYIEWYVTPPLLGPYPHPYYIFEVHPVYEDLECFIYGYFITSTEENEYLLYWYSNGEPYMIYITPGSEGTILQTTNVAINKSAPLYYGDNAYIVALNPIGDSQLYQVGLLVGTYKIVK